MRSRRHGCSDLIESTSQEISMNGSNYFQRNPSLAEQTIQQYKTPDNQRLPDPPTKCNPTTGLLHH